MQILFKSSLKANPDSQAKRYSRTYKSSGRIDRCSMDGSMTVEAALALPLFIFFFTNILSLFLMYKRYTVNMEKLHSSINTLAVAAHELGNGGNDVIELQILQPINPIFDKIGFMGGVTQAGLIAKKWTGYSGFDFLPADDYEEHVYVTEFGEVYHKSLGCSHLQIGLKTVTEAELAYERNGGGSIYRPCEKCAHGISTGVFFITPEGGKYHNSPSCSGLQRKIDVIPISEAGGRRPCSRCGG